MLTFNGNLKVYVALEPCDMRKSFNTLAALARNHLGLDPLRGAAFLFTDKSRRLIKILYFDGTGYWLVAKRLEKAPSVGPRTLKATAASSFSSPPRWPCSPTASTCATVCKDLGTNYDKYRDFVAYGGGDPIGGLADAALMAGGAEVAAFAGEGEEAFVTAVGAVEA
jgi:transposase